MRFPFLMPLNVLSHYFNIANIAHVKCNVNASFYFLNIIHFLTIFAMLLPHVPLHISLQTKASANIATYFLTLVRRQVGMSLFRHTRGIKKGFEITLARNAALLLYLNTLQPRKRQRHFSYIVKPYKISNSFHGSLPPKVAFSLLIQ